MKVLLLLVFGLLMCSTPTQSQELYSEVPSFEVDGIVKTTRFRVNFRDNVIPTPRGVSSIDTIQYPMRDMQVKHFLKGISELYGPLTIRKTIPWVAWGDTTVVNKRTGEVKRVPERSQTFTVDAAVAFPLDSIISELRKLPVVEYAEGPIAIAPLLDPDDTHYVNGNQWYFANIHAPNAWDITTGSPDVRIAIIDVKGGSGGPDYCEHTDFQIPEGGCKFQNPPNVPADEHAGAVAGVAAAVTNNGEGVASLGWNSSLLRYHFSEFNVIADDLPGLIAAAADPQQGNADVMNFSITTYPAGGGDGCPENFWVVHNEMETAVSQGVVIVAAAGNQIQYQQCPDDVPYVQYPAIYPFLIAVSGTDEYDEFVEGWNFGKVLQDPVTGYSRDFIDVSAPGKGTDVDDIWTVGNPNSTEIYGHASGTSMSAPQVSALAALMVSVNPTLNPTNIKTRIQEAADKVGTIYQYDENGRNTRLGYGRINAHEAVKLAIPSRFQVPGELNAALAGC